MSNASQKDSLRAILRADTSGVAASLEAMRQKLGYAPMPSAREGKARGHERGQEWRWVLATLAQE